MKIKSLPIYVTRKTADGHTISYHIPLWATQVGIFIIWLNIVAWGLYGLAEFAKIFIDSF